MNTTKEKDHAKEQAKAQLESIIDMVDDINSTEDEEKREQARETILNDALSIEVRSDWHTPGVEGESTEYTILLCTGGPAVRIIGDLSEWNEPETAKIEYQDWFTPWENYHLTSEQEEIVLQYAFCFYYGE